LQNEASVKNQEPTSKSIPTVPGVEIRRNSSKKLQTTFSVTVRRKLLPKSDIADVQQKSQSKRLKKPTSKFDDFVVEKFPRNLLPDSNKSAHDEVRLVLTYSW